MNNKTVLPVDGKKIEAVLSRNGLSKGDASSKMGYARNAFSWVTTRGRISKPMLTAFCNLTGVTYEAIKPDEQQEKKPEEKPEAGNELVSAFDPEEVRNAIFKGISDAISEHKEGAYETIARACAEAVFNGIQQAVGRYKSELLKDLRGAIYSAVYQANKQYERDVKDATVKASWAQDA